MGTGKAILLFILGMILAFLTFPMAFSVSALLGYVLGITALVLGAYMISKREGRTLPLVLGILLLIISLLSLIGTATVHVGVFTLEKTLQKTTETKNIVGKLGEPLKVRNWEITITSVRQSEYLRSDNSYYRAKTGKKIVLVHLRVKNIGNKSEEASDIWKYALVTNAGRSYDKIFSWSLDYVFSSDLTEEIKSKALSYSELDTSTPVAPNSYIEGDLIFQIPKNEVPEKLYFQVGVIGGYQVSVKLSTST